MRIDNRAPPAGPSSLAAARRPDGGASFSAATGSGSAQPGAIAGAPAPAMLANLDAVLVLQNQTDTPQERRRRSARRGHDILDGLDRLKAALLTGRVGTQDLRSIAERLSERAALSGDPRLDGLIADIEVRAAVELAKLEARPGA